MRKDIFFETLYLKSISPIAFDTYLSLFANLI